MKRMLFNATQQEELRVAIVDGQKLIDIDIETTGREQRKSNIYKGIITRIEPSLEACFINYGEDRHGFLPFKEVARSYFREGVDVRNASIKDALREGQEIVVQVEKEERGNKGAALTSFVSLAGRYLVLMPNNPRGGGVSRRVEGEDRQELRETMDKLDLPSGMSVIARTAGIGRNVEELQWDLNYLMQLWRAIEGAGKSAPGAFLIYQESSLVIRAIRDYFQPDIGEILIDTDDIYEQAQQFMSHVMPDMVHRVKRYRDDAPLFSRFQIEHQIETAYSRTVPLPSGGAIVIDHTEALVSIDVNSARATRGSDIETTAFNTNLEAADEVARQLRLRDLGGLIVIDFIDMESAKNQREVETRLKDALHYDRARVQMGKISRFGLMELSRQRLRPSLSEGSHVTCPRCNGTGHIRDTESSALQVLRIIQEEAMKENSASIHVQAPVDVAAFLLNEKRGEILKIETRHRVAVILIPNKHLETPHYKLERIKHDDPRLEEPQSSYSMAEQTETDVSYNQRQKEEVKPRQEAMVKGITPDQPAPIVERKPAAPASAAPAPSDAPQEEGFLSRLFGLFRKKPVAPAPAPTPVAAEKPQQTRERNGRGQRNRNRNSNRDRNEDRATVRSNGKEDNHKQALPESTATPAAAAPPPRQPRPAKEPREPREPRESREVKETREAKDSREQRDSREGSESRRERPPRTSREERKETVVQVQEREVVITASSSIASITESAKPAPSIVAGDVEVMESDVNETVAESNDEQPRRRRRRGGRNRNRRDRDNNEVAEASGEHDATEVDVAPTELLVQPDFVNAPVATSEAPVIAPQQPASSADMPIVSEPTMAATAFEPEATQSPVTATERRLPEAASTPELPVASQPVGQDSGNTGVVGENLPEPALVISEEAPVKQPESQPATEPGKQAGDRPQGTNAAANTECGALRLEDFQEMLNAAGLTLAVTDPEKVKAAQEAAATVTPAPRMPRARKQLPPISNEPLIQVETQR